jgi:hypothetical protein
MGERQAKPHDGRGDDWRERRRHRVLQGFDPADKRGIESGPLANPTVRKADGDILIHRLDMARRYAVKCRMPARRRLRLWLDFRLLACPSFFARLYPLLRDDGRFR